MNSFHAQSFSKPLLYLRIPAGSRSAIVSERDAEAGCGRGKLVAMVHRMFKPLMDASVRVLSNMV